MSTKQGLVTLIPIKTFLCGAVGGAVTVLVAGAAGTLLPRQAIRNCGTRINLYAAPHPGQWKFTIRLASAER